MSNAKFTAILDGLSQFDLGAHYDQFENTAYVTMPRRRHVIVPGLNDSKQYDGSWLFKLLYPQFDSGHAGIVLSIPNIEHYVDHCFRIIDVSSSMAPSDASRLLAEAMYDMAEVLIEGAL